MLALRHRRPGGVRPRCRAGARGGRPAGRSGAQPSRCPASRSAQHSRADDDVHGDGADPDHDRDRDDPEPAATARSRPDGSGASCHPDRVGADAGASRRRAEPHRRLHRPARGHAGARRDSAGDRRRARRRPASSSRPATARRPARRRPRPAHERRRRRRAPRARSLRTNGRVVVRITFTLPHREKIQLTLRGPAPSCRTAGTVQIQRRPWRQPPRLPRAHPQQGGAAGRLRADAHERFVAVAGRRTAARAGRLAPAHDPPRRLADARAACRDHRQRAPDTPEVAAPRRAVRATGTAGASAPARGTEPSTSAPTRARRRVCSASACRAFPILRLYRSRGRGRSWSC